MNQFLKIVEAAKKIAIFGHVHPDGDCVGSCLALYHYITEQYPEKTATVYLEPVTDNLKFLPGVESIRPIEEASLFDGDLCVAIDVAAIDRLGAAIPVFEAHPNFVIDHHATNTGFGDAREVRGGLSSAAEVLYGLLLPEGLSANSAICLYTAIIHDTGVFKYNSTTQETMCIAGHLMSFGLDTAEIIDGSFYRKSFPETKAVATVLSGAEARLDGSLYIGILTLAQMEQLGVNAGHTGAIVSELRLIEGAEAALFAREDAPGVYKYSLRSNGKVDVSAISVQYGGGGHKMAAGFTHGGPLMETINDIENKIREQLAKAGE